MGEWLLDIENDDLDDQIIIKLENKEMFSGKIRYLLEKFGFEPVKDEKDD